MEIKRNEEFVYGINSIETILSSRPLSIKNLYILNSKKNSRIKSLTHKAKNVGIKVLLKESKFFDKHFVNKNHQGAAAVCEEKEEENEVFLEKLLDKEFLLILILDQLTDPHNVGACLRSAAAANADAVIVPKNRSCHLNATVRKTSSGGSELIPFIIVTNLVRTFKRIKSKGIEILGAESSATTNYSKVNLGKKVAFVIGSEDKGLRKLTKENCDKLIKIDMPGKMESLNTSVCAGILLFEYVRKNKSYV